MIGSVLAIAWKVRREAGYGLVGLDPYSPKLGFQCLTVAHFRGFTPRSWRREVDRVSQKDRGWAAVSDPSHQQFLGKQFTV